jgi:5-methylcytosine-specific restriction endonuclease McrA
MQRCSVCKEEKPLDEYYLDKRGKNGLRANCKSCVLAKLKVNYQNKRQEKLSKRAEYYKAHAEKSKTYSKEWRIANPDKTRQYHQEYATANVEKERIRHREKSKRERLNNPEKVKERGRKWSQANPEKVAKNNHNRRVMTTGSAAFLILEKEIKHVLRTPCAKCGSLDKLSLDHVIPLARGGRHSIGNLQSLCKPCNSSKGKKTIMEWRISA